MRLRWGICGCGSISSKFVNALTLLPESEHQVVALAARSEERATIFAKTNNLESAQCYGSYALLYENSEIDVIYVGVINRLHYEIVMKALKSGKNVLCEKPLGLNTKQIKEIVNCARENKCFLMEAIWSRCFPVYQEIKTEIDSGVIGDVKFVMANFGFLKPDDQIERVLDKEGGGFLIDIGIYLIQLAQFVFGGERPTKINVEGWTHERTGVDITGAITLVYPENRIAQLLYSGAAPLQNDAQIIGTNGRLMIPELCWCPTMLHKKIGTNECVTFHQELPQQTSGPFAKHTSRGLHYEARCVRECIMNGLTECPRMPLDESIVISEIMDECRRQLGVKYEVDQSDIDL